MQAAWQEHGEVMGGLRLVLATVRLRGDGTAEVVVIDPPLRARGLSQCIAEALLGWQQAGVVRPRAWVELRLAPR